MAHESSVSTSGSALSLGGPDAVLASLPYLVGFTPTESMVLLWISDNKIAMTQRADLPEPGSDLTLWRDTIWAPIGRLKPDAMLCIAISERADIDELAAIIVAAAPKQSVAVQEILLVKDGRWRSQLCQDPHCCPPGGNHVNPDVATRVAAHMVLQGHAPMSSREAVSSLYDPQPAALAVAEPLIRARVAELQQQPAQARALLLQSSAALLEQASSGLPLTEPELVELVVAMSDIIVRDSALLAMRDMTRDQLEGTQAALVAATRTAPAGYVSGPATVAAVCAWQLGDGVRASAALSRALADDPDYQLAQIVSSAVRNGMPPGAWRQAMAELTAEEIRAPQIGWKTGRDSTPPGRIR